jgi:hypothetical protein
VGEGRKGQAIKGIVSLRVNAITATNAATRKINVGLNIQISSLRKDEMVKSTLSSP